MDRMQMINLGQVYGAAEQIKGQRQRNRLLDLQAENEPQRQQSQNRLLDLSIQSKEQGLERGQQTGQMNELKLSDAQRAQGAQEAKLFLDTLGSDFGQLDPQTQQQRWMAARQQQVQLDPEDEQHIPQQFDAGFVQQIQGMAGYGAKPSSPSAFDQKLISAGYRPGSPEYQHAARSLLNKSSGTTVNVGTGGAASTDPFAGVFGDSGEGKRLEIQARALARNESLDPLDAIERVALQKDVSQSERTADTYYQRMLGATSDIEGMESKGFNPTAGDSILEQFPGGNFLVGDDYQQYKATASEWIRAKLRKESGAAIPPEEMSSEFATYFYVPGDSQATIRQKRALRARAETAMQGERERLGKDEGAETSSGNVKWDDL